MLQQTRVETVIPYWIRWMTIYPNVSALAKASSDDVNKLWAGLGYYRRAQMLLKGAQKVVEDYNGIIPSTAEELLNIPGIGPYTAGAIASIASNQVTPLVDGNVIRVFSRIMATTLVSGTSEMDKFCWSLAKELVDPIKPGDFNQGLMELGATVCKVTNPNCNECPARNLCKANLLVKSIQPTSDTPIVTNESKSKKRKKSEIEETIVEEINGLPISVCYFPRKLAKKRPREVIIYVNVYLSKSLDNTVKYLMVRRANDGLLANQWEFPNIVTFDEKDMQLNENEVFGDKLKLPIDSLTVQFKEHLRTVFGIHWLQSLIKLEKPTTTTSNVLTTETDNDNITMISNEDTKIIELEEPIIHVFSHQRHTMHVSIHQTKINRYDYVNTNSQQREYQWMTSTEIKNCGMTTGCKKVLTQVLKYHS